MPENRRLNSVIQLHDALPIDYSEQERLLCLSHQQTHVYHEKFGVWHDAEVLRGRDDIRSSVSGVHEQKCHNSDAIR